MLYTLVAVKQQRFEAVIDREMEPVLTSLFSQYPFVTVTGPRQAGKTTLCRTAFPELPYANLEAYDQREFARDDPRGFLDQFDQGAIIDEIQRVPELLSYLQVLGDERGTNSQFVLTGSENLALSRGISQSLAGRTAVLHLLPCSLSERRQVQPEANVDEILFSGFYPRILDQELDPTRALGDYFATYVERDVRRLGGVRNLSGFETFTSLTAGRIGQTLNLSKLGADAGVSHTTASEWLSVLEASYIVFRLRPHSANTRKRLTKSPKLYFHDVGLASFLLGINEPEQIATHPLKGALFENAAVIEILKHHHNRGIRPNLAFYRDSQGLECDLLWRSGNQSHAFEMKSGTTVSSSYFKAINKMTNVLPAVATKIIVHGGRERHTQSGCEVVPFLRLDDALDELTVGSLHRSLDRVGTAAASLTDKGRDPLDDVFHSLVQPVLYSFGNALQPWEQLVCGKVQQVDLIVRGSSKIEWEGVLSPSNWPQTKSRFLTPNLELQDETLVLGRTTKFVTLTEEGNERFSIELKLAWHFEAHQAVQAGWIDDALIEGFGAAFAYSDPNRAKDTIPAAVTAVVNAFAHRVNQHLQA